MEHRQSGMYGMLGLAIGINTIIMFALTYAMVWEWSHVFLNLNRFYMALMMAAPMVVVMLLVMGGMYKNKRLNLGLIALSVAVFAGTFALARMQMPIGDQQFLRSMIPHHSSAILMCEEADLTDPEVQELCRKIVQAQKEEIAQMKAMLEQGK